MVSEEGIEYLIAPFYLPQQSITPQGFEHTPRPRPRLSSAGVMPRHLKVDQ